jgi:hypothetical protein
MFCCRFVSLQLWLPHCLFVSLFFCMPVQSLCCLFFFFVCVSFCLSTYLLQFCLLAVLSVSNTPCQHQQQQQQQHKPVDALSYEGRPLVLRSAIMGSPLRHMFVFSILFVLVGGDDSTNASTGNGATPTKSASDEGSSQHPQHTEHFRPTIHGLTPATVVIGNNLAYLFTCFLFFCLFSLCPFVPVCLSVYLFVCLSVHVHPSINCFTPATVVIGNKLSVSLYPCLPICLLFVCLSA